MTIARPIEPFVVAGADDGDGTRAQQATDRLCVGEVVAPQVGVDPGRVSFDVELCRRDAATGVAPTDDESRAREHVGHGRVALEEVRLEAADPALPLPRAASASSSWVPTPRCCSASSTTNAISATCGSSVMSYSPMPTILPSTSAASMQCRPSSAGSGRTRRGGEVRDVEECPYSCCTRSTIRVAQRPDVHGRAVGQACDVIAGEGVRRHAGDDHRSTLELAVPHAARRRGRRRSSGYVSTWGRIRPASRERDHLEELGNRSPVGRCDRELVGHGEEPDRERAATDSHDREMSERSRGCRTEPHGLVDAHEVEHDVGAYARRRRPHRVERVVGHHDGLVGADVACQCQCVRSTGRRRRSEPGRGRRRIWTAMWPRPPAPTTTAVEPGTSRGSDRFTAWYGVSAASVRGAASTGSRSPIGTRWRADGTIMNSAMPPSAPRPPPAAGNVRLAYAVVLEALHTAVARATAPRAVDRHGRSHLDAADARSERVDPACVLVAEGERRAPGQQPLVEVVHQVEVGVAGTGTADAHAHFARPRLGIGDRRRARGRASKLSASVRARGFLPRSDVCPRMVTPCSGSR